MSERISFAATCREAAKAEALAAWSNYDDTCAVLEALAGLIEDAEKAAGQHDPTICTCLTHIGQQLIQSLAAGYQPPFPSRTGQPDQ